MIEEHRLSKGNIVIFYLSKTRNYKTAKYFIQKALRSLHALTPRSIIIDKNPAYLY
ncbi:DDE-type integrase/transposase/recombinase [Priestia megaterium]|uniref:DDE-type integrase/transposase/recombinase n=1 Tax=Priestia megaterium TaxID=1404 RepID=UPI003A806DC3